MGKRTKALLLVACVVGLATLFCPRRVSSQPLSAAEAKNHIGATATVGGKVMSCFLASPIVPTS
jgi:hypothetical protein